MTKRKPMQIAPLNGDQCVTVKAVINQILESLRECSDGRFDSGDRLEVNLSKRNVGRLRSALKKL